MSLASLTGCKLFLFLEWSYLWANLPDAVCPYLWLNPVGTGAVYNLTAFNYTSHRKSSFLHEKLWGGHTLIFHHLSLQPCHAHIISLSWNSRLKKEGKKEKLGTLWSGRWLWCSQHVCASIRWFTNGLANVGSAEIRGRAVPSATRKHTKPEMVLDLQGPQLGHTHTLPSSGPCIPGEMSSFSKTSAAIGLYSSSLRRI